MVDLKARDLEVSYLDKTIIQNLNLTLTSGAITTIIGPNGCGKSTLLKALTRILPAKKGLVLLDGQAISSLPTKEVAKKLALLPQMVDNVEHITVLELVSYGRFPHQKGLGRLTDADREKINWAMSVTKMTGFANHLVDDLSGGLRQKAWIAMALAQDTEMIFLDEPTTYLDLNHQLEILTLLQSLNRDSGKTIVMVLHDLNQAARFSDVLVGMTAGQISHQGRVEEVLTPETIRQLFEIEPILTTDPDSGRPVLISYNLLTTSFF